MLRLLEEGGGGGGGLGERGIDRTFTFNILKFIIYSKRGGVDNDTILFSISFNILNSRI